MAVVIMMNFFFSSFEGGFNSQSNEGTSGQELFSPLLRFPGDSVTKLYKKVTEERLIIEVEGMLTLQSTKVTISTTALMLRNLHFSYSVYLCIFHDYFFEQFLFVMWIKCVFCKL